MDWSKASGFKGQGTYAIFNKHSKLCLHSERTPTLEMPWGACDTIKTSSYFPCTQTQLWKFSKYFCKNVYMIQNVGRRTTLLFAHGDVGSGKPVAVGSEYEILDDVSGAKYPDDKNALWAIDETMCSLEEENTVMLRSVYSQGYVLQLQLGEDGIEESVGVGREEQNLDRQKWLLLKMD
ncbi:MAG: hypothetical protein LQ350_007203 [Teloschistes chrysophthalmus]|nr:MAG: hypothetical protein LQ350_007203 [Niorma chrysophthalma]